MGGREEPPWLKCQWTMTTCRNSPELSLLLMCQFAFRCQFDLSTKEPDRSQEKSFLSLPQLDVCSIGAIVIAGFVCTCFRPQSEKLDSSGRYGVPPPSTDPLGLVDSLLEAPSAKKGR